MFKVTKEFRFEMAHVLSNYDGPCGNLHGHSYRCLVTFESDQLSLTNQESMVMDFNEVKQMVSDIIDRMDHAFAYNLYTTDEFEKELAFLCSKYNKKFVTFNTRTTAEEMSKAIFSEIDRVLYPKYNGTIKCSSVQLYETTTGSATYSEV